MRQECKSICKVLVKHSPNNDNNIIENIAKLNESVLITIANNLLKGECRKVCKRGSRSILQNKKHRDFIKFSWEHFYYELQSSCPL